MKKLIINRFLDDGERTLGYIKCPDLPYYLYSLEETWKDNQKEISCIPCGEYEVKANHNSPVFGKNCFMIKEVPNRGAILFHAGNLDDHTKGCILTGMTLTNIKDEPAVGQSAACLQLLKSIYKEDFKLIIIDIRKKD